MKHDTYTQIINQAIQDGDLRITGTPASSEVIELTPKGTTRAALSFLEDILDRADRAHREFTTKEKREILQHIERIRQVLKTGS